MGVSYRKRAQSWEITVQRNGERAFQTVHGTKEDVKAVVRELARLEATGHNIIESLRLARQATTAPEPQPAPTFPTLRQVLPEWIAGKVESGDLRASTGKSYRSRCATWLLDEGEDVRWVQAQLGHATIAQTVDTYSHVDAARHEAGVETLNRYLTP